MKVIFHIGMGKTGTTSIQNTLPENSEHLASQNVQYLGRQFNVIAPEYDGFQGIKAFAESNAAAMKSNAATFIQFMKRQQKRQGIEIFILSNETIFAHPDSFKPFIEALRKAVDVHLITYLRDPAEWLPSAYTQWAVRHKQRPGKITPFEVFGPKLIQRYNPIRDWHENFGDILTVRKFDKSKDVVLDFAETTDIDIRPLDERSLVRAEPVEIVLRGLFNNRFEAATLPNDFNRAILDTNNVNPVPVKDMVDTAFDYSAKTKIIAKNKDLFDYIKKDIGIDFSSNDKSKSRIRYDKHIQLRVVDYLVEIVMEQGLRLQAAEEQIKALKTEIDKP